MAAVDLVQMIDLSLGSQPCGVVNFNYLHGLLHEIVKRLVEVEGLQAAGGGPTTVRVELKEGTDAGSEQAPPVPEGEVVEREPSLERKPSDLETAGAPVQPAPSTTLKRTGSQLRVKPSIVTAANDLSALERKLQALETRMNTMETLPELLERKSSDAQATPVRDMWNFTNLNNRLSATEDGLDKTSGLVDELLGEVQGLKSQVTAFDDTLGDMNDKLSTNQSNMEQKVKELEAMKLAAAEDSMGAAAAGLLSELQGKIDALQAETSNMKQTVDTLDPSAYVTSSQLESALGKALKQQEEALKKQAEDLSASERSLRECSENLNALNDKVELMEEGMGKFTEQVNEMETKKVNVSDLASLIPQGGGSDEGASFMPKLIELQSKLAQLEEQLGKQPGIPSDLLDQIASMQKAIDNLSAELASLSSLMSSVGEDRGRLDDIGSQMAQLRERMTELDRAVTAISNAVSEARLQPEAPEEEEGAKYVGADALESLQGMLGQLQQEQERLMGTAAHLSHELEVNREHVKSLYSSVDDLRESKVDKDQLAVEVREKADRTALEGKASRDWVDSTFEKLDREIREATSKLLGQEEAFRTAVDQLNEDVEGKLDRMELQPLKDYFDKKLDRVKNAPTIIRKEEAMADDAAGFKKPLRFRCISCDKPVGIKPLGAIPALPSVQVFPGTRSFRPYTTYELEVIRRHQRMGFPIVASQTDLHRSIRSAGGSHTLTRPHQRIRIAPLGTGNVYTPEPTYTPSRTTQTSPTIQDELEIIGQDGHIYKGRSGRRLPPIGKPPRTSGSDYRRVTRANRPSTSPLEQPVNS